MEKQDSKPTRTDAQNRSLHKWFSQLSEECQRNGVTFDLIIRHTHQMQVTEEGVKHLWHVLQKALFGKESTTELKKTGQIETMLMHFADLFGKEGIEIPPWPSDDLRQWEELSGPALGQHGNKQKVDYEDMTESTSGNKF